MFGDAKDILGPEAEETPESGGEDSDDVKSAEDVMAAIQMGDAQALADALRAFFQKVDAEPHVEGGT